MKLAQLTTDSNCSNGTWDKEKKFSLYPINIFISTHNKRCCLRVQISDSCSKDTNIFWNVFLFFPSKLFQLFSPLVIFFQRWITFQFQFLNNSSKWFLLVYKTSEQTSGIHSFDKITLLQSHPSTWQWDQSNLLLLAIMLQVEINQLTTNNSNTYCSTTHDGMFEIDYLNTIFYYRKDEHVDLLYAKPLPKWLCTNSVWQLCRPSSGGSEDTSAQVLEQTSLFSMFILHQKYFLPRWTTMVRCKQSSLVFGTRLARC